MAKKEKRFIRTHSESSVFEDTAIWVDRETGVNYLWHGSSLGSGLTHLLDREGRPIITTVLDIEEE